jgi:ferredoxin
MSDLNDRMPENVPGPFYVDGTCIDCDRCRGSVPQFFTRWDEGGYSIVHRQPRTAEERELAIEALEDCPTQSIGCDGSMVEAGEMPIAVKG